MRQAPGDRVAERLLGEAAHHREPLWRHLPADPKISVQPDRAEPRCRAPSPPRPPRSPPRSTPADVDDEQAAVRARPFSTPTQMRRASSRPETTSRSRPVSRFTLRTIFPGCAPRARRSWRPPAPSRGSGGRAPRTGGRREEPVGDLSRHAAGREDPSPGRTRSRSWCRVSIDPSGSGRAISMRTAFVPTSMAARIRCRSCVNPPPPSESIRPLPSTERPGSPEKFTRASLAHGPRGRHDLSRRRSATPRTPAARPRRPPGRSA